MRAMLDVPAAGLRALALLAVLGLGCGDPRPTEPDAVPAFAKGSGSGPTVTATSPSFGEQGAANLDVQIIGSGFDQGSQAAWDSGGAPYPRITVNSTKFVTSTQLTANITIASNATVQYYDVAVTTSTGRKGVGTELFTVTLATSIPGATSAVAVNDAGRVTGLDASGIYVFDVPTQAFQDIGFAGTPWAIDQLGTTVSGGNSAGLPAIWTLAGSWSEHTIPDLGLGGAARGLASDGGTGAATVLTGNVNRSCNTGNCRTPAKWTPDGTGGWTLTTLPLPAGSPTGFGQGINASSMAVGMEGTNCCKAFFWDAAGNVTVLPQLVSGAATAAWAINDAGTTIVGSSNHVAVAWIRASTGDPWTTPVTLENTASFCTINKHGTSIASGAYDVNAAGLVVGQSCGVPVAWKPSGSGYTRVPLGDLGNHQGGLANAINNAASPIAAGTAGQGVYWTNF